MVQEQSNHGNWNYYKNYHEGDKNIFLIDSRVNFLKLIHQLHLNNLLLQNENFFFFWATLQPLIQKKNRQVHFNGNYTWLETEDIDGLLCLWTDLPTYSK